MRRLAFLSLTLLTFSLSSLCLQADDKAPTESPALKPLFEERGLIGTFVLLDATSSQLIVHNPDRAAKRFIPASTFKIPNSLISLETRAVNSVDEVLPYGGKKQFLPEWEHDMPLREAIRLSAVPIYQEAARRVGLERMRQQLKLMDYGNQQTGEVVDQFWLKGPLKISAIEQTTFLLRMIRGDFQRSAANYAAVRDITTLETSGPFTLHGKTGWCTTGEPNLGWWVGWIERDQQVTATFALNIDMAKMEDGKKRIELGRACLDKLGYLPLTTAK